MLTDWLDKPLAQVGDALGMPGYISPDQISRIYGTEAMATVGEMASKWMLQPAAHKIAGLGLGGLIGFGATTMPGLPTRTRTELMEVSSHMLFRIADPAPEEMRDVQENFEEIAQAVKNLDASGFVNATVRSPNDITRAIDNLKEMVGQSEYATVEDLGGFEDYDEFVGEVPEETKVAEIMEAGNETESESESESEVPEESSGKVEEELVV